MLKTHVLTAIMFHRTVKELMLLDTHDTNMLNTRKKAKKRKLEKVKKAEEEKKGEDKKKGGSSKSGEDNMFQLSKMRFATVSEFRGKVMVGIREYYEVDGEMKSGKKGISLSMEQWTALKDHIEDIDEAVKNMS